MKSELSVIGLAAIAVVLGLIAVPSAPTLAMIAFILAGVAVIGAGATALTRMVR